MGVFSWITADTEKSIPVEGNLGHKKCFTVYLLAPDGTYYQEDYYQGYGVFGGRDAFALLAQWNEPDKCVGDDDKDRSIGIDLRYNRPEDMRCPIKIVEELPNDKSRKSIKAYYNRLGESEDCPYQGYFYDDEYNPDDFLIQDEEEM